VTDRVPTPTASAELVTEFSFQIQDKLEIIKTKIFRNISNYINGLNQLIKLNNSKLKNPLTLLREKSQNLDNLDLRIQATTSNDNIK
jgi:exonuclease VII large subunit